MGMSQSLVSRLRTKTTNSLTLSPVMQKHSCNRAWKIPTRIVSDNPLPSTLCQITEPYHGDNATCQRPNSQPQVRNCPREFWLVLEAYSCTFLSPDSHPNLSKLNRGKAPDKVSNSVEALFTKRDQYQALYTVSLEYETIPGEKIFCITKSLPKALSSLLFEERGLFRYGHDKKHRKLWLSTRSRPENYSLLIAFCGCCDVDSKWEILFLWVWNRFCIFMP